MCLYVFLINFCVLCLFDLRYPGVHQSGSRSGEHQRGGCWALPRHEWERRALWVGESKKKKNSFHSQSHPHHADMGLIHKSGTRYKWLVLQNALFFSHSRKTKLFFLQYASELSSQKICFQEKSQETVCYQGSHMQIRKPQWDKTSMFLFTESHTPWNILLPTATKTV